MAILPARFCYDERKGPAGLGFYTLGQFHVHTKSDVTLNTKRLLETSEKNCLRPRLLIEKGAGQTFHAE